MTAQKSSSCCRLATCATAQMSIWYWCDAGMIQFDRVFLQAHLLQPVLHMQLLHTSSATCWSLAAGQLQTALVTCMCLTQTPCTGPVLRQKGLHLRHELVRQCSFLYSNFRNILCWLLAPTWCLAFELKSGICSACLTGTQVMLTSGLTNLLMLQCLGSPQN